MKKLKTLLSENRRNYFYIMHLSYNGDERERLWKYARKNNLIGLDVPNVVTDDWDKVRNIAKGRLPPIWVKQFDTFCYEMKKGDVVVVLEGWHCILGIAMIDEELYLYMKELSKGEEPTFFDHVRHVQWVVKYEYGKQPKLPSPIKGFNNTLYNVKPGTRRWSALAEFTW